MEDLKDPQKDEERAKVKEKFTLALNPELDLHKHSNLTGNSFWKATQPILAIEEQYEQQARIDENIKQYMGITKVFDSDRKDFAR